MRFEPTAQPDVGKPQLIRCMLYADMNMVRARVVKHPRQWPFADITR